jgi:F-type H+-transporting ATPase subunit delta
MADSRVAWRYVKSLLQLAVEQKAVEQVHSDMLLFSNVCEQSRDFSLMLRNPIIKHDRKRAILEKTFRGKVHNLTLAIFNIITLKNREPLLPEIARQFHIAYTDYKGIGRASVVTAIPLDDTLRTEMEAMVKKISKRNQVELNEKVKPEIIGGFVLNVGDRQIDASMRSKLNALKLNLSQNPFVKEF